MVTRSTIAQKLEAYLQGNEPLDALVDWAERSLMDAELDPIAIEVISQSLARIGLADVREFGLTWQECQEIFHRLGYRAQIQVSAA